MSAYLLHDVQAVIAVSVGEGRIGECEWIVNKKECLSLPFAWPVL